MKFLLATLGSIGDLMPFLAVAEGLRQRGHRLLIATNSGYGALVQGSGFDFAAIWHQSQQSLDDALANDPIRAWQMVREQMFVPATEPAFNLIADVARREPCAVLASWSVLGAQLAQDRLGVKLATAYLSPHTLVQDGGPNKIGFFPDWFCPMQAPAKLAGFPMFPDSLLPALPPELEAFLAAGPPPVIVNPGSFLRDTRSFFQEALAACAALGLRAVLLSPYGAQVSSLPATAQHHRYVPLQRLAPRAAALLHHGGIGTCAQALRAGIPQLIAPLFYDQFDNAACVTALGQGDTIDRRDYAADTLAQKLAALLASRPIRDTAIRLRTKMMEQDAVSAICDFAESLILG